MGRLGQITLEDVVRGLMRYWPGALTVVAILAVLAIMPGDAASRGDRKFAGQAPGVQVTGGATTTPATGADASTGAVISDSAAGSYSTGPVSAASSSTAGSYDYDVGPSLSYDYAAAEGFTPPSDSAAEGEGEPLQVSATAWATRTAGMPLARTGVPEGSLPVGTRVFQDDKRSFLRLTGDRRMLVLREVPDGRREPSRGAPTVRACQVTEAGWQPGEGKSFDEAPDFQADSCVEGKAGDGGTWSFDLSGLPSPTDDRGIALVPGQGAPVDFQVAFEPRALAQS